MADAKAQRHRGTKGEERLEEEGESISITITIKIKIKKPRTLLGTRFWVLVSTIKRPEPSAQNREPST